MQKLQSLYDHKRGHKAEITACAHKRNHKSWQYSHYVIKSVIANSDNKAST